MKRPFGKTVSDDADQASRHTTGKDTGAEPVRLGEKGDRQAYGEGRCAGKPGRQFSGRVNT